MLSGCVRGFVQRHALTGRSVSVNGSLSLCAGLPCTLPSSPDIWLESLRRPRSAGEALMRTEPLGGGSFLAVEISPHAGSVISRSVSQLQRPLRPDPAVPHRAGRGRHHLLRDPAVLQGKDRNQGRERLGRVPPGTDRHFSPRSASRSLVFSHFLTLRRPPRSSCLLPVNWSNASTPSGPHPSPHRPSPLSAALSSPHLSASLTSLPSSHPFSPSSSLSP